MGRIKRPTKRVANTGQSGFAFCHTPVPPAAARRPISDERFLDDESYHLMIGDQRLDQVLVNNDMRWVVELRQLMEGLDYSLLTAQVARAAAQRCATRARQGKPTTTVVVASSDPDAVVQPRKDKVQRPAYKPSTLMHAAGVIIGQYVDASSETAAVGPLSQQHHEVFGERPPTLLLDAGYHHGPLLGELAAQGLDVLCPSGKAMGDDDWEKKGAKGLFAKNQFSYDDQHDGYTCPAQALLSYSDQGKDARGRPYRRYRSAACPQCSLRAQCTTSKSGRSIKRYAGDEYKEAMAVVLLQPRAREVYGQRMVIAETVHAECRERFGLRRFHRRGLSAVRAEFGLYCIAFNLKRALRDSAVLVVFAISSRPGRASWAATEISVLSLRILSPGQAE